MQVSHVETANTHAIMGGGKARSFTMSQSAEFFTVLSDTLYRDKKRAVVREVICNAWDAHINAGKTDTPIEITLTDDELIIQDFGPGIADERMDAIYITYGASTKVQNEEETGGFGLGSKAPFAYSDHFTVTSSHAGTKTVYAISRGGLETNGVPDMRVMVSVPEEQSGLTVSIPIRTEEDAREFRENIKSVVLQGGMKATLNGLALPAKDYTKARQSGFLLDATHIDLNESPVYVLYGTVLYPVSSTESEIQGLVRKFKSLFQGSHVAILIAPPNSVGVTPSRESLSYTDKTIATIQELGDRVIQSVGSRIKQAEKLIIQEFVSGLDEKDWRAGLRDAEDYPDVITNKNVTGFSEITDPLKAAKAVVRRRGFQGHRKNIITKKLGLLAARRWRDSRGSIRRILAYEKPKMRFKDGCFKAEAQRAYRKLVVRAASRSNTLKNLFIVNGCGREDLRSARFNELKILHDPKKIFVVAQSRVEAVTRLKDLLKNSDDFEQERTYFCAAIPRNKPKIRAALIKEVIALGFTVEEVQQALPKKKVVKREARKFVDLTDLNPHSIVGIGKQTLESPDYYIQLTSRKYDLQCWILDERNLFTRMMKKQFGEASIAVVRSETEKKQVEKRGAKDAIAELVKGIKRQSKTTTAMIADLLETGTVTNDKGSHHYGSVLKAKRIIESCPEAFFEFVDFRIPNKKSVLALAEKRRAVWGYFQHSGVRPFSYELDFSEFSQAAREKFKNQLPSTNEFNHRFDGLRHIETYYIDKDDPALIVKLIRAIKNNDPMPQKESNYE